MNMAYQQQTVVVVESPKIFLHQKIRITQSYVKPSFLILKLVNWCFGLGFQVNMINQVKRNVHFAVDNFLERCCDVTVVCKVQELRSLFGLFWPVSKYFLQRSSLVPCSTSSTVIINPHSVSLHSLNIAHSLVSVIKNYGLILIQYLAHPKCY